jgi:hypothetical protein
MLLHSGAFIHSFVTAIKGGAVQHRLSWSRGVQGMMCVDRMFAHVVVLLAGVFVPNLHVQVDCFKLPKGQVRHVAKLSDVHSCIDVCACARHYPSCEHLVCNPAFA